MEDTESILTAILQKEIKRLKTINAELLKTCKLAVTYLEDGAPNIALKRLEQAITKGKGKE